MNTKTINIFWTGGWDSTFRVLQLSIKPLIIQPYYLKDDRKSEKQELDAIKILTEKILKLETTKATINPLITEKVISVKNNTQITTAFNKISNDFKQISKNQKLGTQYEWLAQFSTNIQNLELGIEKDSKVIDVINQFGELELKYDKDIGEYFIVNQTKSSAEINKVFGNYHFPLLNLSKLKMKSISEDLGHIDIMNQTWFCHRPIDKKPCGRCRPCVQTIDFGLKYRFTRRALVRYKLKKIEKKLKNTFG